MKTAKIKITLILIGLLAITLCFGQQKLNPNGLLPADPKVSKGILPNGMTYYVRANSTPKNRANLYLVVKAGSVDEDDNQQGLAHFAEHMAFNGTKNFPKNELVKYLESIGMGFGPEINAYTSFDETVYSIEIPLDSTKYIDKGLLVLYDWASQVTDSDEEIEKERGVIHEEWRGGRNADERMMQKWLPVFLHNSKYADRLAIGKVDIIDHFKPELLRKFRKDWYRPDLQAVIITGDFDQQSMVKQVTEMFSKIPAARNPRKKENYGIPNHKETLVSIVTDKEAQYPVIQIMYKHPLKKNKTLGDYRQSLVRELYNSMINDRLTELSQRENPPFLMAYSGYGPLFGPGSVYSSKIVCENGKTEEGIEAILAENQRVLKFGFTRSELERQKSAMMGYIESAYSEREKQQSKAYAEEYKRNFLTTEEPFPGIENELTYFNTFIPEITLEEVNALAGGWMTKENRVVIVTAPELAGVAIPSETDILRYFDEAENENLTPYLDVVPDKPLVTVEPKAGSVVSVKAIDPVGAEEWTLSNGAKVIFKSTDFKENEIVFSAYSPGGNSVYGPQDDVSAYLAPNILYLSGLGDYNKVALDKFLTGKTVALTPYVDQVSEGLEGSSSVKDAETLFQLIHMYFVGQRVDSAAYHSLFNRTAVSLQNKISSPEAAFQDTLQVVSANYNPRKLPLTLQRLKEADFSRITQINHERFSDASNFQFFFVGKIDKATFKSFVEKYLASIPSSYKNESWKNLGIKEPSGRIDKTVCKGKDAQSFQKLVFHGPYDFTRNNHLLIYLLSKITTTRLLETIREEKSSVYFIDATSTIEKYPEPKYNISITYGADPAKMTELKDAVFAQIKDIAQNGPSAPDLQKAKEKMLRERETNLRDNNYWLFVLNNNCVNYNGDFSQFSLYEKVVNSFTADDIKAAAKKWFDFNNYYGVALKPEAM